MKQGTVAKFSLCRHSEAEGRRISKLIRSFPFPFASLKVRGGMTGNGISQQSQQLLFIFFVFAAVILKPALAQSLPEGKPLLNIKAEVDRTSVTIGDKIKYTVTVSSPKGLELELPAFVQTLGAWTVSDSGSDKNIFFNRQKLRLWYVLVTYTTGKLTIPKTGIKYRRTEQKEWNRLETGEIAIEVKSLLQGQDIETRDIVGPVSLPSKRRRWLIFTLAGLGVFLAAAALFSRRKKTQKITPPRPAHEIACEELRKLKDKDLIGQGKIKEYYTGVSDIIRRYIEGRFGLRAPEETTEEFLISLKSSTELISEHKTLLGEFLSGCDLVKFARHTPARAEIDAVFDLAKQFIESTK